MPTPCHPEQPRPGGISTVSSRTAESRRDLAVALPHGVQKSKVPRRSAPSGRQYYDTAANANANTAKEKLHQAQHEGEEQQLKAKHAAEGKQDSVGSQVSEGAQKTWNKTKEGTEKGWDKTKEVSEKGWNATKSGAEKGWDKTKTGAEELKNKVTE